MSTSSLRIAVLSDLHFGSSARGKEHTYVIAGEPAIDRQHPVEDLMRLIAENRLSADVVICPGDMTLQADRIGLEQAWAALNRITAELGASHLLVSTGNHDISSREKKKENTPGSEMLDESPEIWERLKQLMPSYPYPQGGREKRLEYWAEHFFTVDINGVRFCVLNSCNSHARGENEYERGRVTDYTISKIRDSVSGLPHPMLNILVCHHHPMKHPDLSQLYSDYSEMVQGRALLSALEETGQSWLVIHGHKHSPRIEYAQGESGDSPVVFSAGSFSAVLSPRNFPAGRNQFYIIDLDLDYVRSNGAAGIINAWDWTLGKGWFSSVKGASESRVPTGAGFGHRSNARDARQISEHFSTVDRVDWKSVTDEFDFVRYVTPGDLKNLLKRLDNDYGLEARWADDSLFPTELLRRNP